MYERFSRFQVYYARAPSFLPRTRLRCVLYFGEGVAEGSGVGARCSTVAALPLSGR
jgi:hypothetical protein